MTQIIENWIENFQSAANELVRSLIVLDSESSVFKLESSVVELVSSVIELESSSIQIERYLIHLRIVKLESSLI